MCSTADVPSYEAVFNRSPVSLQNDAEAKAYLQYVAFYHATNRYVPVILTDGNIIILYIHHPGRNANQRLYWAFDQSLDASTYLKKLVKHIAQANPLLRPYVAGQDIQSDSNDGLGTNRKSPSCTHHTDGQDHIDTAVRGSEQAPAGLQSSVLMHVSPAQHQHGPNMHKSELHDAQFQETMRLARFHPCVTTVHGLPKYSNPQSCKLDPYA